jgi:hypothetical protein
MFGLVGFWDLKAKNKLVITSRVTIGSIIFFIFEVDYFLIFKNFGNPELKVRKNAALIMNFNI